MAYNPASAVEMVLASTRCYRDLTRIRRDSLDLMNSFTALRPIASPPPPQASMATGQAPLLTFSGTIPIFYQNNRYNIPVRIWVPDSYPYRPPSAFITPTPDMLITRNHKHVDPTGMVYLPYLNTWNPASHSLSGLAQTMSQTFGLQPPLYARGPSDLSTSQPASQPTYPLPQQQQQQPQQQGYGLTSSGYGAYPSPQQQPPPPQQQGYPYPPPQGAYGSPYPQQQQPQQQPPTTGYPSPYGATSGYPMSGYPPPSPVGTEAAGTMSRTGSASSMGAFASAVAFASGLLGRHDKPMPPPPTEQEQKMAAVMKKLQERLAEYMAKEQKNVDEQLKEEIAMSSELKSKEFQLAEIKQTMANEEKESQKMQAEIETLRKWLEENDKPFDIDEKTESQDVVRKQLIRAVAMDNMLDDTIYQLDKGLQKETVPLDQFLKQMREAASEQFMHRALIKKIRETLSSSGRR